MNIHLRLANYIARYAPSRKKVLQYLSKKGRNDAEQLLQELHYDEEILLSAWIRTFLAQGKGKGEMRQKLLLKGFQKDDIEAKIEHFSDEIMDFASMQNFIENFVKTQLSKKKSLPYIREKLFQKYLYFKDEILEIITRYDDRDSLFAEAEKYFSRYDVNNPSDLQKFYRALLGKGFRYGDVKEFLNHKKV